MENEIINDSINEDLQEPQQIATEKAKFKFKSETGIFSFLFIFSLVFLLSTYFFNIYITPIKVVGISMQPTINALAETDADRDHCDIVYYRSKSSYNRNDIIIATNPNQKYVIRDDVDFFIKRIVARGGDTIKFIPTADIPAYIPNSKMYYYVEVFDKNGTKILSEENYIKEEMFFYNNTEAYETALTYELFYQLFTAIKNAQILEITIPENQYFVMGDNRNNSSDSRIFGCVEHQDIAGVVELQVESGESLITAILEKLNIA